MESSDRSSHMTIQLLRVPRVAQILGVSTARVYQLVRSGSLPSVHLDRQVRVDADALRRWILAGGSKRDAASGESHSHPNEFGLGVG